MNEDGIRLEGLHELYSPRSYFGITERLVETSLLRKLLHPPRKRSLHVRVLSTKFRRESVRVDVGKGVLRRSGGCSCIDLRGYRLRCLFASGLNGSVLRVGRSECFSDSVKAVESQKFLLGQTRTGSAKESWSSACSTASTSMISSARCEADSSAARIWEPIWYPISSGSTCMW